MTKAEQVKLKVRHDVWQILRKVYNISSVSERSEKQTELCDQIAEYVAAKLAPNMTLKELEEILQ